MKKHLSNIFNPQSGNTVMFAFDHGYFMGSTAGLERLDLVIPKLLPYVDVLMGTRGALRSCVTPALSLIHIYRGYNTLEDSQVKENVLKAELEDMQLLAHCNGDMAAEQYMDQLETVYRELGSGHSRKPGFYRGDIRPVMIHAQLLGLDQLERVKKLGVIPSFFLAHVYHWGDIHVRNFGSVSYTHLDVYKRQSVSGSVSGREAWETDVPLS